MGHKNARDKFDISRIPGPSREEDKCLAIWLNGKLGQVKHAREHNQDNNYYCHVCILLPRKLLPTIIWRRRETFVGVSAWFAVCLALIFPTPLVFLLPDWRGQTTCVNYDHLCEETRLVGASWVLFRFVLGPNRIREITPEWRIPGQT